MKIRYEKGRDYLNKINYQLIRRLERAEHLIRADVMTARLQADEFQKKADELTEQANILANARTQLWKIDLEDNNNG